MFETMVQFLMAEHLYGLTFEPPLGGAGYPRMLAPWRKPYPTRDGYICVLPYTDRQWTRFFAIAGRPELASDPRFADMASRARSYETLYGMVGEIMPERDTAEWLALLDEAEVPAMAVVEPDDLPRDPHLMETGFFQVMEHPSEGAVRTMAPPVGLSASPAEVRRLAPRLGEHGREVLAEAGLSAAEIEALIASGATLDGA